MAQDTIPYFVHSRTLELRDLRYGDKGQKVVCTVPHVYGDQIAAIGVIAVAQTVDRHLPERHQRIRLRTGPGMRAPYSSLSKLVTEHALTRLTSPPSVDD